MDGQNSSTIKLYPLTKAKRKANYQKIHWGCSATAETTSNLVCQKMAPSLT